MDEPEDVIALADRHVQEAEERVTEQASIVGRLEEAGRRREADGARAVLKAMRTTLDIARAHLLVLRAWPDGRLDGP
jgi:hypothetical protein